jgi:formylglycine-generating enzyme required for sulfatase activity
VRSNVMVAVLASAISAALLSGCGKKEEAPADAAPPAASVQPAAAPDAASAPAAADTERTYELRKRLMDSTAQQEEWVPELIATPVDSVADMLRQAEQSMRAGRIEQGEGNALTIYLSILETAPDNPEAKAGVDAVVTELVKRGEQSLTQGRFTESARLAQVVTRLRPEDEAVKSFKSKVDAGREVALMIGEAQRLAGEGRIVAPEGSNAAAIYRDVLRTDPNNAAATEGLSKLESDLIARATAAAEAGQYSESDRLLADAGRVRPGSQNVQNASTRVVELRQRRADQLLQQAGAAIDAGRLDEATGLLTQLEQVSAQAQGLEELRARIDSARNYASLKPGQVLSDPLRAGGKGPELVVIPLGNFQMGSPDGEPNRKSNEGPRRVVTIGRGFAMARNETTVAEFRAFVEATGYTPTSRQSGSSTIYDEKSGSMADKRGVTWENDHAGERAAGNLPVIHVSWTDAKAYADWLARDTGKRYRLPSEAEFEYVLRSGSQTMYPWGDGNPGRVVGNLTGDKDRSASRRNWVNAFDNYSDGFWGPAPVRNYEPNRWGVYDLIGNVSEWVEDCWHENYQRAPSDGSAWVNPGCNSRVLRGASWASAPDQVRSAFRLTAGPSTTNPRLGFRVVRDL